MAAVTRFLMIGGFLGAGKTTLMGRLAAEYQARGMRIGLVTNDQANDLVDTKLLQAEGFQVGEVAGACFCCSFDRLTETMRTLGDGRRPDIILAEPVGSCTDLVATVAQPIRQFHEHEFTVGPYSVILKPSHGRRILSNGLSGGFSPQAEYIFRKQLEEADLIIINRIDQLLADEVEELAELIQHQYPGRQVLRLSAKTGQGIKSLITAMQADGEFCRRILDLDYDVYAEGEAELGWLNASCRVTAVAAFEMDVRLLEVIEDLKIRFREQQIEPAHLKVLAFSKDGHGVANLISSDTPATLSVASTAKSQTMDLVINARVATHPQKLEKVVRRSLDQLARDWHCDLEYRTVNTLRPGRPVPTHRLTSNDGA